MKPAYSVLVLMSLLSLLKGLASTSKPSATINQPKEVIYELLPAPPTTGEGVQVTVGNASPGNMRLTMKSVSSSYQITIDPCPTCIVHISEPPPGCPADTVYTTFVLRPEHYQVQVTNTSTAGNSYQSTLDLTNGQPYNGCFHVTYDNRHKDMQDYR